MHKCIVDDKPLRKRLASLRDVRAGELAGMLLGPVGSAVSLHMRRGAAWKGGEGKIYTVDLNRRWAAAGLKELPEDY